MIRAVHTTQSSPPAAQGHIPGAIAEMQKTVALSPELREAYLSLALLQSSTNQLEAAEANFKGHRPN